MEFLDPVNRPVRWLAILALILAIPLLAVLVLFLATLPLREPGLDSGDLAKLAAIVVFFTAIMGVSGRMLARLLRETVSSDVVSRMPGWFMRVCGAGALAGTGWLAWTGEAPLVLLVEFAFLGLSMFFIGGLIRGRG